MGEEEEEPNLPPSPHRPSSSSQPTTNGEDAPPSPPPPPPPPPQPRFDPSRMIGIIKRKALIKDLAAVYHAECLSYCQQLLELQKKREEPFVGKKAFEEVRKETLRPPKRQKKNSERRKDAKPGMTPEERREQQKIEEALNASSL